MPTLCLITVSSQVGHSHHERECVCLPARMWRDGSVLEAGRFWRSNNYSCLDEVKFLTKTNKRGICLWEGFNLLAVSWQTLTLYWIEIICHKAFPRVVTPLSVPEIGDSSCPCCHLFSSFCFIYFFLPAPPHPCHPPSHAERSCFQSPSGLLFIKNQSTSQRGTFQTHAAPEADDEARVNIRVVKL